MTFAASSWCSRSAGRSNAIYLPRLAGLRGHCGHRRDLHPHARPGDLYDHPTSPWGLLPPDKVSRLIGRLAIGSRRSRSKLCSVVALPFIAKAGVGPAAFSRSRDLGGDLIGMRARPLMLLGKYAAKPAIPISPASPCLASASPARRVALSRSDADQSGPASALRHRQRHAGAHQPYARQGGAHSGEAGRCRDRAAEDDRPARCQRPLLYSRLRSSFSRLASSCTFSSTARRCSNNLPTTSASSCRCSGSASASPCFQRASSPNAGAGLPVMGAADSSAPSPLPSWRLQARWNGPWWPSSSPARPGAASS